MPFRATGSRAIVMPENTTATKSSVSPPPLAVVGIGSAAGGLEALHQFFNELPIDLGLAIVVVQHLDTDRSVNLAELVSKLSPLPVHGLTSSPILPEANLVYVAPEQCQVELTDEGLSATKIKDAATSFVSRNEQDIHQISQRIVLDEFAPRYAVVNEEGHLVSSSPGLERYFEFPDSPFQNNVVHMAKPGLRSGLRAALREAQESLRTVKRENLTVKSGDSVQRMELVVQPMPVIGEQSNLFMLVFRDAVVIHPSTSGFPDSLSESESTITQLERELDQTRDDLENMVRDLGTANEELKSSKEEVQAGIEALAHSRRDLENLLEGTKIATIFLDSRGLIRSFTRPVSEVYNLKASDIGRPLSDITHNAIEMPQLPSVEEIATWEQSAQEEFQTEGGRWFMRYTLPYVQEGRPSGVILTLVDISDQKRAEVRLAVAHSVTQLLSTTESFEEVIYEVLEAIRDNLDADICALWLIDSDTNSLFCSELAKLANSTRLESFVETTRSLRLQKGEGLAGRAWETE